MEAFLLGDMAAHAVGRTMEDMEYLQRAPYSHPVKGRRRRHRHRGARVGSRPTGEHRPRHLAAGRRWGRPARGDLLEPQAEVVQPAVSG